MDLANTDELMLTNVASWLRHSRQSKPFSPTLSRPTNQSNWLLSYKTF